MSKYLVFVYGTLKHGFNNHHLLDDSDYLGHVETSESKWQMYSLGGFPGVVAGENTIYGEMYSVSQYTFDMCDRLEGHPTFYKRELVDVVDGDGVSYTAWMYVYQGSTQGLTKVGGW